MADAKKCDACGEFYVIEGINEDIVVTYNDPTVLMKINYRKYDTCPECMRAFFNFIESRQKVAVKSTCEDCKYEELPEDADPCYYCTNKNSQFLPKEVEANDKSE